MHNLWDPLTSILGPHQWTRKMASKLLGERVIDALFHFPTGIIHRRRAQEPSQELLDKVITLTVTVERCSFIRKPFRVSCIAKETPLDLVFFNGRPRFLERLLTPGNKIVVSGKLTAARYSKMICYEIVHPDHLGTLSTENDWVGHEPIYPLTQGVTQKTVRAIIKRAFSCLTNLPEWSDNTFLARKGWPPFDLALKQVHTPYTEADPQLLSAARARLVFDEFLAYHIGMLLSHRENRRLPAQGFKPSAVLVQKLYELLPFSLTADQERVISEIHQDLSMGLQMVRLLQGDVGSGKTIVALAAALQVIDGGAQVAFLAPTDILARQHYETLSKFMQQLGLSCHLLTGRDKGKSRQKILADSQTGSAALVVGTHALLEDDVAFKNLGFVIVDEQHRFGVEQRARLCQKAENPHILSMTATPIPRTLMLANYGDMDVSLLKEKPACRLPIDTRVLSLKKLDAVVDSVATFIANGGKLFWVCPLVEETEESTYTAVSERYTHLSKHFPGNVTFVHGQMKSAEKDAAMEAFAKGTIQILIATTVIEVGVDVPAASLMIIEHAERFGLAQLHQLRGRIGRGALKSTCLLLYGDVLTPIAQKRLEMMRITNNGFELAEADLKLRGSGEALGTRQSGLPKFRFSSFNNDDEMLNVAINDLFLEAHDHAKTVLEKHVDAADKEAIALLLKLFNVDNGVRLRHFG